MYKKGNNSVQFMRIVLCQRKILHTQRKEKNMIDRKKTRKIKFMNIYI